MRWYRYAMTGTWLVVALALVSQETARGDVVLVEKGAPRAVIVTADQPAPAARQAAEAFQKVVAQMTGASLPIQTGSAYAGEKPAVLVGTSELTRKAGVEVVQDRDGIDEYVIKANDNRVVLAGNDAGVLRGSAYAVYDLLQRLGCGWYGPDPLWQVIPSRETLTVPAMTVTEKPAFKLRDNWVVRGLDKSLQDAWRLGGWPVAHSHALDRLLPREKYLKDHPDWFGPKQLCLTHPEVIARVADAFRKRIEASEGIVSFSLSANDALGFCDCYRCRATGNAGACSLYFANAIARNLNATHAGRFLLTFYAFWGTHDAPFPSMPAEPGVCVMIVNEGNHMQPLDAPEQPDIGQIIDRNNTRERIAFDGWKRTGAVLGIYEWWIPACDHPVWQEVPWSCGRTSLRNLRFWQRGGVEYVTYQTGIEKGNGFPLRWPLYYVGARGLWNPDVAAGEVMHEACAKLFGQVADNMFNFYQSLDQAMLDSGLRAKSWRLPSPELVYTPAVVQEATMWINRSRKGAVDPDVQARIAEERKMWDHACEVMARLRVHPEGHQPSKANPGM